MELAATDEQQPDQGIYQNTNRPPKLTINNIPNEVPLEIFDSFRQSVDPYDQKWKKEHNIYGSISPMCITVGPEKPEHIKTILSGPLPTSLDYCEEEITGTAGSILWRMRAVLKHHPDRVREITPEGESVSFFKMTNCTFPMLESVSLSFFSHIPNIPAKFLRGPDLSYLHHLRRLTVKCIAFMSIFDFLLSTTALTDLTLVIDTTLCPTPETSLLACLQVMPCLLSLDLTLLDRPIDSDTPSESSTPEDTVILEYPEEVFIHSKLKRFHLTGDLIVLKDFTRWLRAPSLEYLKYHGIGPGFSLLLDNDIGEHFDTA